MTATIEIEKIIHDLLHNNDCVIVPGFGGFVTVYKPATILPKQKVMLPPSREIGFNKKLINNDGLLANEIAQKSGLTFEKSLIEIQNRVAFYQSELARVKRLEISNIGVLYIDKDGNYRFLPDESKNFLKESFGLGKIYLDKINTQEKEQPKKETKVISIQKESAEGDKTPFAWKKVAGIAAIALFLLGGYWLGSKMNTSNTSLAMLNPFADKRKEVKAEYQNNVEHATWPEKQEKTQSLETLLTNTTDKTITYSFEEEAISNQGITIHTDQDQTSPEKESTKLVAEERSTAKNPTGKEISTPKNGSSNQAFEYYIVAGAFQERTNADKLVNKLKRKGFNAHVFDKKKGLNYVCFEGYATKNEAKSDLLRIKKITPSAWVKSR